MECCPAVGRNRRQGRRNQCDGAGAYPTIACPETRQCRARNLASSIVLRWQARYRKVAVRAALHRLVKGRITTRIKLVRVRKRNVPHPGARSSAFDKIQLSGQGVSSLRPATKLAAHTRERGLINVDDDVEVVPGW